MSHVHLACGACFHLRRECLPDCELEQYYPLSLLDRFKSVDSVFGGNDVSRIVRSIPDPQRRADAVSIINDETEMHIINQNYRCHGLIQELQLRLNQLDTVISNAEQTIPLDTLILNPYYQQLRQERIDVMKHQWILQVLDNLFLQRQIRSQEQLGVQQQPLILQWQQQQLVLQAQHQQTVLQGIQAGQHQGNVSQQQQQQPVFEDIKAGQHQGNVSQQQQQQPFFQDIQAGQHQGIEPEQQFHATDQQQQQQQPLTTQWEQQQQPQANKRTRQS